jgi:hypothetical protein
MKYYLVAFNSNDQSGEGYSPIGGLDDVIGYSEFPQDLINYVTDGSFYTDGHILFIKEDTIFIYAVCEGREWEIFDTATKLEDYNKIMRLG